MKILLTHGYFLREDPKELQIMKPYVPLGILYISSFLEQHGFLNQVFDSTFSTLETLQKELLEKKPDVVAIYTNLMTKLNVLKIVRFIRSQHSLTSCKIILGGPEVRNHRENFLRYGADLIVIGEGEETILELIRHLDDPETSELNQIRGIAYLEKNEVITTADRPLIKNIDHLPLPNRKKIDFTPYLGTWKKHHGYSMMSVNTMRGCPYTCKWCSRAVYGGSYRRRSPALVAEELKFIKEMYQPDMIWFVDDVFTIHHNWLREFAAQVKKQDAVIPYEIISRADRLSEEVIKILKDSGCFRVWVGAESGSQKIIDAMDRRVDVTKTAEMIQLIKKHGIEAGTFIMLGYPGETKQDIKETIKHLINSDPSQYTITVTYPIKGTPLYEEVQPHFINNQLSWDSSTDRDIDFKRTYKKQYYQNAIKWVMNEVYLNTKNNKLWKRPYLKLKSLKYQLQMEWSK